MVNVTFLDSHRFGTHIITCLKLGMWKQYLKNNTLIIVGWKVQYESNINIYTKNLNMISTSYHLWLNC